MREDTGFLEIEAAWWKWIDENCQSKSPRARAKWIRESTFTFEGVVWHRRSTTFRSNSGKTIVERDTCFVSEDGRTLSGGAGSP